MCVDFISYNADILVYILRCILFPLICLSLLEMMFLRSVCADIFMPTIMCQLYVDLIPIITNYMICYVLSRKF